MIWSLPGLFALSFSAATLLPGGSEAALLLLAAKGQYTTTTLLLVASTGNILGSLVNYALGRYALRYRHRRWFPVSPAQLTKAQNWFTRWGQYSVLAAWLPLIGDPITVAAGVMRMNWLRFLLLVTLSKSLRYAALLGLFGAFA
ncbi:YqaA family protein [Parasedimentitalea psychrophila]|uniref:YqaA family protein n=1 Tax=Parasedimentitalea psychrophila TaxID=2997337 RepID=A0A9Y2L0R1_9RHOB|nr:YqaA family protein [Parasedimentitalea psychrophila]WIY25551.1 YqaA family protein [Parasedimentitalea psychrophila]